MASLPLLAASARTGVVAAPLRVYGQHLGGDLVRIPSRRQELLHAAHRRIDVPEEDLVARTEVIQPRFAVGGLDEPVLRAAAVAREQERARAAVPRQRVPLIRPERTLLRRRNELEHALLVDVAEQVVGLDEMVARVQIPVVLHRESVSTRRGVDTEGVSPDVRTERYIEHLDEHAADLVADPFL